MQVSAQGKIKSPVEQGLEFGANIDGVAAAYSSAHRLNREQTIDLAVQQILEWNIGVILAIAMGVTQQPVEVGITLVILRHEDQRIL